MQSQRSGLVWLVMAGFCGLIGFVVVYHYANFERPIIRFAIVIDAGSTQTRSSLFTITLDTPELTKWLDSGASYNEDDESNDDNEVYSTPLNELLQVKQISSCVNGGPMASLSSQFEADKLVKKCLKKFTRLIKLLDFENDDNDDDNDNLDERFALLTRQKSLVVGSSQLQQTTNSTKTTQDDSDSDTSLLLESSELSKQMDLVNHHVSSVTHYYLGATAGMRALAQLNETRALEKLDWVDRALNKSNSLVEYGSPYLNRGYVSIISGSDEAAYGWTSVNFICDKLVAKSITNPTQIESRQDTDQDEGSSYSLEQESQTQQVKRTSHKMPESIGTIELGGASAQMAFETKYSDLSSFVNDPFEARQLKLFNGQYNLVTRSDLCLGMSQAVLRANYILMRRHFEMNKFANLRPINQSSSSQQQVFLSEIENPCGQLRARTSLSSTELSKIFASACLVPSESDLNSDIFKDFITRTNLKIALVGSSNLNQCETLLDNLIDSNKCKNYFKLCPDSTPKQLQSISSSSSSSSSAIKINNNGMPFVTISGYNHALRAINLTPKNASLSLKPKVAQLESIISEKLGGRSIEFDEFVNETRSLCSTNFDEISSKFPRVNKAYQMVICLQLVYIRKLLTEFYGFNPIISGNKNNETSSSWSQIKFLLFQPTEAQQKQLQHNGKRDIGWALGLLLNTTSQQLGKAAVSNDLDVVGDGSASVEEEIFFHHGASVKFALRATLLLMLACCLIGMSMLIAGLIWARESNRTGSAFSNHSSSYIVASTPTVLRREPVGSSEATNESAHRKFGRSMSSQLPGVSGAGNASNMSYGSIFETRWSSNVRTKAAELDRQIETLPPKQC